MSSRLGPMEIECDAPPYAVVCACREVGLESPEDVRWRHRSRFQRRWDALTNLFGSGSWSALLGGKEPERTTCSCGQPMPTLDTCTFMFRSGKTQSYKLGQCPRCHTIFWDEA